MIFGFSYWGFCEEYNDSCVVDTPDGGRFTRPIFVKELLSRGISVVSLQKQREIKPINGLSFSSGFPKIDCLFIEWRWSTYKNDVSHPLHKKEYYEPDLDRQSELLDYYSGKIPIIIWDTDIKMTEDDVRKHSKHAILMEPTIVNRDGFERLLYFTDYSIDLFDCTKPLNRYVYVGSNYERYSSVDKYYFSISNELRKNGIEVHFWGNWLNVSPERPEQSEMIKKYSDGIFFHKRNKFIDGMQIINSSICVTHISKNEYYKRGLITPRFFESLACNTPAFVPEEFIVNDMYGAEFVVNEKNILEKIIEVGDFNFQERQAACFKQRENMAKVLPDTDVKACINKILKYFGGQNAVSN